MLYIGNACGSSCAGSPRRLGPCQQFSKVIIDAGDTEIRLTAKGLAQVVHFVRITIQKLDDGKDEIIRLVERLEDFIARDGDGWRARYSPLHFDET